ncbi:MAG: non-ribosomal peptide synthetase [Thermoanaerobaculia bacterium]
MSDLAARIASLPPEKRALLEERLLTARESRPPAPAIPRRAGSGPTPLSFAQQRLWFLDRLDPGKSLYNVPEALALRGPLDAAALERALRQIVRRHEVLRTSFGGDNGEPLARVEEVSVSLPVTDLTGLPAGKRDAEARRLAAAEGDAPFDLARAPLFRARLLRLAPEEHWLLLTMHHIVSDEWSIGVLFEELSELYAAQKSGREPALPSLPIQYADYAVWQREWLRGGVLDAQLAYWKERLAGGLPVLALPTDRPRPAVQTFRGAEHRRRVGGRLSRELEALSRREGATLFMTLLAAFQVLLSRYSGQEDVLVGTPIAGRNRAEAENLIGFFVNTLVLRGDLSGEPTFVQLLRRVRETALEAYANQDLPFEKFVEELRPERSLSHSPIFQVMFELDNAPTAGLQLRGLAVEPVELPDTDAKFDLRLLAVAEPEGLLLVFEFAADLFAEETISRMAGHFETLLEGIVSDPLRPVSRLPLLTSAETRRQLVEWNDTRADYPREKCLHRLFEEQAVRSPEEVAVESEGGQTMTYGELDGRANRLARYLRALGVGPEVLVGLCVPRSPEMVVGLLGVLKAGGAYVPLDPTYPAERLAFMLEDTGVHVLLTVESVTDGLPPFAGRVVHLDSEWDAIARLPGEPGDSGATPDNLAYVMYTSGSTGKPKGVMIPHRGVVNYLTWCVRAYGIERGRGAPVQSSLSFDLTVTGLLGPLLCGRRVRLLPEGFGIDALGSVLREEGGFSLVKTTPARLDLLAQQIWPEQAAGCTRAFVIGGEALREESLTFWRDFTPESALFNEYGPTETVVGCCVYRVPPEEPRTGPVPIGRPIANTRLYVLDRCLQPVPIGVTGELYVGGDGVGRGYWKRPELTAERFLKDPFSAEPGVRLYRTGDLARYRADGNIEFLGRSDDQVKIRGFRVELGEVEAVIREVPAVQDVAVALREDAPGDRRLVAYVIPEPDLSWSPETTRLRLQERLPEYMVPSVFVRLESLPVTRNGKLDRRALPPPDWKHRQLEREYEAPQDALELHLTKIWEAVLQTAPIGLDDDFFDLGGHSLLAVRLFAQIERATGRKLPLATLFQAPTVGQIAEVLRERGWSSPWSSLVPIQARGSRPPFYCVHAAGGGVLPYRALSRRLGPDQPFYGLQARALVEGIKAPTRVEEMAEEYLAEIQSLQPEGPYYIGGHSAGGTVAYEIACRLLARGEKVALLALFDTWAPGHGEVIPEKLVRVMLSESWRRLGRFFSGIRKGARLRYLREKLAIRVKVLRGRASDVPPELQELRESIEQAAEAYHPAQAYPGKIALFRARRQPPEYALDRTLGWGAFAAGGVEVHKVPGFHGEVVEEPQAAILAEGLRECLDRAVQAASRTA